jgi:hypothetical protein
MSAATMRRPRSQTPSYTRGSDCGGTLCSSFRLLFLGFGNEMKRKWPILLRTRDSEILFLVRGDSLLTVFLCASHDQSHSTVTKARVLRFAFLLLHYFYCVEKDVIADYRLLTLRVHTFGGRMDSRPLNARFVLIQLDWQTLSTMLQMEIWGLPATGPLHGGFHCPLSLALLAVYNFGSFFFR